MCSAHISCQVARPHFKRQHLHDFWSDVSLWLPKCTLRACSTSSELMVPIPQWLIGIEEKINQLLHQSGAITVNRVTPEFPHGITLSCPWRNLFYWHFPPFAFPPTHSLTVVSWNYLLDNERSPSLGMLLGKTKEYKPSAWSENLREKLSLSQNDIFLIDRIRESKLTLRGKNI